jgi:hypothetical protein
VAGESFEALWGRWEQARRAGRTNVVLEKIIDQGRDAFVQDVVDQLITAMPTPSDIQAIEAVWWPAIVEDDRDIQVALTQAEQERLSRQEQSDLLRMRREQVFAAQEYLHKTASPVMQAVIQLEQEVFEGVQSLLESVQKKGSIHHKQVAQLERLREMYNLTRIRDNQELLNAFGALEDAMNQTPPEQTNGKKTKYNADAIQEAMRQISEAIIPEARQESGQIGALEI